MKSIMVRTFYVYAFLACFFAFGKQASAYWQIATDTVWRLSDSPIVAADSVWIKPGIKLTIEPGVVIKFSASDPYKRLLINQGVLEAIGTQGNQIIFTSIYDDLAGGDTNGDGSATNPQTGDWWQLNLSGNTIFNSVIIRYGGLDGSVAINNYRGQTEIKNSIITQNGAAIGNDEGNLIINNSSILNNPSIDGFEYGIQNYGRSGYIKTISAQNNWWGTADGPCAWRGLVPSTTPPWQIDFSALCGSKPLIDDNIIYFPWLTQPPEPEREKRHPVVLIPGILGSWPDMAGEKLILDPITHTYTDLWDALVQADYAPGVTLFSFPYEWRRSNAITAKLLKEKISEVRSVCISSDIMDCSKVDLIGHSMGGLVARQYIESDDYADDVDQMIFIATPHKGAPFAYTAWEGGYLSGGGTIKDFVLWAILAIEAGKKTGIWGDAGLVAYLHDYNIDSVKELLPIYNYIYDQDAGSVRYYPDNYPANPFLENLNSEANLNKLKSAVKITNIVGNIGDSTISGFNVTGSAKPLPMWANGMPVDFYVSKAGVLTDAGDSTVPNFSNSNFLGLTDILIGKEHGEIVGYAQKEIIKELTGEEPEMEIHNKKITSLLMISLRCPADIQVIAPDGKRLGWDAGSSSTLAEIAGGYYYRSDDSNWPEFAVIPEPLAGKYQVKAVGTDNGGSYAVDVNYINEATTTSVAYSAVILPGQEQSLNFDFSSSSDSVAEIKADITIATAISDVARVYGQGLLADKNAKKKLIQQYESLKLKVEIIDKLIKLAEESVQKLGNNAKLPAIIKDKLVILANREIDKLENRRSGQISGALNDQNKYLQKLLAGGVLKQLGYDIIKTNNGYLINNW